MQESSDDVIQARDYQINLVETALKQNTIIYLPTGTGKTFIAVMVLRQMAASLEKPISQGGKISIMVVNTHALVNQQSQYLQRLTPFEVLAYGGRKNISARKKTMWKHELDKYQILVITPKTLVNIVRASILSLEDINLLIFDECHRAVNNHPMRQLMANFNQLKEPPRIVGLTATLVNKTCLPNKLVAEIETLEMTLHSKIATIELQHIIEFSTNPKEILKTFKEEEESSVTVNAISYLQDLISLLAVFRLDTNSANRFLSDTNSVDSGKMPPNLVSTEKGLKGIIKMIKDTIIQIRMLGTFGGRVAVVVRMEQLQIIKKNCQNLKVNVLLDAVITTFRIIKAMFENEMVNYNESKCLYKYSSQKVLTLLDILTEYQNQSKELLCGIIFVQRRFTAKILYHLLMLLKLSDPKFEYLRPNYILGNNINSSSSTVQFYTQKAYKNILNQFLHKEINLLVASNVLEEGVDIPTCTLVVNFDIPVNYRAYIQSKGRARHKNAFYYLMIDTNEYTKFTRAYEMYQQVEKELNSHLTAFRKNKYTLLIDEEVCKPCVSAVDILRQYCSSLPSDKYTSYVPNWYLEEIENHNGTFYKVTVQLPTVCPILEPIEGPYMKSKKFAKGAAALKACELLHELGELDNNFQPKCQDVIDDNKMFFFNHWPKQDEPDINSSKKGKMYARQIPLICRGQIKPHKAIFLHIIELIPVFPPNPTDAAQSILHRIYSSKYCYGILTAQPLPELCKFPLHVSAGEITVNFRVNQDIIILNSADIIAIKTFHHFIFQEVMELLKGYLIFNNDEDAEILMVVPVLKMGHSYQIDTNITNSIRFVNNKKSVHACESNQGLSIEKYLGRIVTTTYGNKAQKYLVTNISSNQTTLNQSCSEFFANFGHRSSKKPLLVVRELTKKINHLKPCNEDIKPSKGNKSENADEYLLPDYCVLHNFQSDLWVQAELLPSVLYRIMALLQVEELRRKIAIETGLGVANLAKGETWKPLILDKSTNEYKIEDKEVIQKIKPQRFTHESEDNKQLSPLLAMQLTLDALNEMIHMQFPWLRKDTPCHSEHNLHISFMDMEFYDYSEEHVVISRKVNKTLPLTSAMSNTTTGVKSEIKLLKFERNSRGPELAEILKAITTTKSNDVLNLERLETLGDSFLKLSTSLFIFLKYPHYNEGKASIFKAHLISNKNLHYVGVAKNLGGYLINFSLSADWKPPCFCVPKQYRDKIKDDQTSISLLGDLMCTKEEQISGILSKHKESMGDEKLLQQVDEVSFESIFTILEMQKIPNKTIADSIEALISVYFQSCGFIGGLKLLEWLNIIPRSENAENLLSMTPTSPTLLSNVTKNNIDCHLPSWQKIEERLGYHFKNRAYLLQALTHSSYTFNRLTNNYQMLEFLGDAILDFIITCHIYESYKYLNPGQLTDLRSALVNNITFASFAVRCGFHKFILFSNEKLLQYIDEFVQFQESKDFVIDDEVMILFEENDLYLAEQIDVPKVLSDVFESLAAAIFLDSGMNFQVVWNVFYSIMHKEIEQFSRNIPKNAIRLIYESVDAQPKYHKPVVIDNGATMVGLDFILKGESKTVYGFGENKLFAKRAAAKIALRLLTKQ